MSEPPRSYMLQPGSLKFYPKHQTLNPDPKQAVGFTIPTPEDMTDALDAANATLTTERAPISMLESDSDMQPGQIQSSKHLRLYLERQGDFVSRSITPIYLTHIVNLNISLLTHLLRLRDRPSRV